MPFNGVGIFQRVYQWSNDAANGLFVDSTRTDTDNNDIASGLTNCMTRDGQSPATANIPLGGFKITGLAAGALATDAVNFGQAFTNPTFVGLTATGTINLAGGVVTVATQAPGNNTTLAASTAFVVQQAFSAALPAQSLGFLRSTGAVASFGVTHTGYAQNEVKGADIASAATINLTTATGNFDHITGTTGITGITIPIGALRSVVFDGALTLTNSASLLLPGAANITTSAGARADIRGDTAGAIVMNYMPADGRAIRETMALLGSATVGAAVANIDFLSIFTSDYDRYTIELEGILPTAADSLSMRMAVAGSANSGTNYSTMLGNGGSVTIGQTSFLLANSAGTSLGTIGTIHVRNANDAVRYKSIGFYGIYTNSTPFTDAIAKEGAYTGATALTGFRLFWSGGTTFSAGIVRVYGHRNT